MWTCSTCGHENEPKAELCAHCGDTDSDELGEAFETEAVEPHRNQENDWTPLQFNIKHIIVFTAILGLALGIFRFAWDLSAAEFQLLCGFGVTVGTVVFVPVVIYWLFKSK